MILDAAAERLGKLEGKRDQLLAREPLDMGLARPYHYINKMDDTVRTPHLLFKIHPANNINKFLLKCRYMAII